MTAYQFHEMGDAASFMAARSNYYLFKNNGINFYVIINNKKIHGDEFVDKNFTNAVGFNITTSLYSDIYLINSGVVLRELPTNNGGDIEFSAAKYNNALISTDIRYISNKATAVNFINTYALDMIAKDFNAIPKSERTMAEIALNRHHIQGRISRTSIEE